MRIASLSHWLTLVVVTAWLSCVPAVAEPIAFRDCPAAEACPLLVVVPASTPGTQIGSPQDENGRLESEQRHAVSIQRFAIGAFEVRVVEYMACVKAGGCRHPEWLEPGGAHNIKTGSGVTYKSMSEYITGDDQPVVGISWEDASAYAAWMSAKTNKTYRLPSESEWEYAARAGSETRFWWGDEQAPGPEAKACCRDCGSALDGTGLYPVTAFAPNPFGLYNVHGNVWEWVADYFCEDYNSIPKDGSAQLQPQCTPPSPIDGLRVFRGGSCFYEARQMRASMRLRNFPKFRNQTVGFRIARSIAADEAFAKPSADSAK